MTLRAEQTLKAVLSGTEGLARGVAYVPRDLLATVMRVPEEDALEAACSAMDLDFAFVADEVSGATSLSRALYGMGVAPFWSLSGPLGRVVQEHGWRSVLMDTIEDPHGLGSALDDAANIACESVDVAAGARVFAVVIADDLAGTDGMIVSPDWVIEELMPRLARIAVYASEKGMVPVFHSDGDVRSVLVALGKAGFSALHTGGDGAAAFERTYTAARRAGLAMVGGLEGAELRGGELSAVAAGTRAAVVGAGSGLLVADDGGLTTVKEVAALMTALGAAKGHASRGGE